VGVYSLSKIFAATDTGLLRQTNQDMYRVEIISKTLAFAMLCDGMGGERGGGVASALAADCAYTALRRELGARFESEMTELSIRSILTSAVAAANAVVYDEAQREPELSGMGTTMLLAVFYRDAAYIAYVGDSRVYLANARETRLLTRDHTVVQMLVDMGEITQEDAKNHPKRHFITRAVGVGPAVEADFGVQALEPEDWILMCSDGLHGYLETDIIYELLKRCGEEETAWPLIGFAIDRGGADNITAVAYRFTEDKQLG
jgi:protein phosphatase